MKKHPFIFALPLGKENFSWQQAAARCTRCHACSQNCPAYLLDPQEAFSPRGRQQLIKWLADGKLKQIDTALYEQLAQTCLFCGRCTTACAGRLPTAHQMLAWQHTQESPLAPRSFQRLIARRLTQPRRFDFFMRAALLVRRLGISYLLYPFLPAWLKKAHRLFNRSLKPLRKELTTADLSANAAQADLIFLPSVYAEYIDGKTALYTLRAAKTRQPVIWHNTSTGLEFYLYGNQTACLRAVRQLLTRWEKTAAKKPLPLLTDSIELYSFLRHYPSLLERWPRWKARAEKMAEHIHFVTDYRLPRAEQLAQQKTGLDSSSVLYPVTETAERARQILTTQVGKNLVECEYSRFPLPAAAVGIVHSKQADRYTQAQLQALARHQLTQVYHLSGWAVLELQAAGKRAGLAVQARPIAYLWNAYAFNTKRQPTLVRRRKVKSAR